MGDMVIVSYRPKPGREADLLALTREHVPILRALGLATDGPTLAMRSKSGAIGRVPGFLKHRFGIALVKQGPEGNPLRGPDGFCQRVATGEAGEAIGRIAGGAARFEGYSDAAAAWHRTEAKRTSVFWRLWS